MVLPEAPQPIPLLELPDPAPVLEAAERVSEAASELLSFSTIGPFIDLGFDTSIDAQDVVGITFFNGKGRHTIDTEFWPENDHEIGSAVKLRDGMWVPSSLTYQQLRNRLRKAGAAFI